MDAVTIAQLITAVCTLVTVIWGFVLAKEKLEETGNELRKAEERRKEEYVEKRKRRTIEFYSRIREDVREELALILDRFPGLKQVDPERIVRDKALKNAVEKYLSSLQDISVGINAGLYDFEVFAELAGVEIIGWYSKLNLAIELFREKYMVKTGISRSVAFEGISDLVARLEKERGGRVVFRHGKDIVFVGDEEDGD